VRTFDKYQIPQQGARCLELGTGWVHWESTVVRLFYDARATLFDVWDNRQLGPFKAYFEGFRDVLSQDAEIPAARRDRALRLLDQVLEATSFDDVYRLLGFEYVVERSGRLTGLAQDSYDACFSYNVFEHIDEAIVAEYVRDLHRVLKPGGYCFLVIDISDHLANYDQGVSRKHYLKYSDAIWDRCFANDVQYFNRIQRGEWLRLFKQAGFELVEEHSIGQPIRVPVSKKYEHLGREDLECTSLEVVYRKVS
jgi:SAM-dependent methyltransferase